MRKTVIKRVFLTDGTPNQILIPQDFIGSLSNEAILDALFQVGKDIWIGNEMYHMVHQDGMVRHWRYEVYTVIQYEKSWYDHLIDAVKRI